jgi:hypothetical protein
MTRFGGSRKSFLIDSFFPTAVDMSEVLGELQPKLLVTNTRVASDYVSTPVEEHNRRAPLGLESELISADPGRCPGLACFAPSGQVGCRTC